MNRAPASDQVPGGLQGACPEGWHMTGDGEWQVLEKYMGMSNSEASVIGWRISGSVGGKLKETGTSH